MPGRTVRHQRGSFRYLLAGLNRIHDQLSALTPHAATFSEAELSRYLIPVVIRDPFRSVLVGSGFFRSFSEENDIPLKRYIQTLERQDRHEIRHDAFLVIARSAAINIAAFAVRAEGTVFDPLLRIDGDGVGVAHKQH